MSDLKYVQSFFTRYLRDAGFRDSFQNVEKAKRLGELDLSEKSKATLTEIDFTSLDVVADGIISERYDKRKGEFTEFISHLSVFYNPEAFFRQFDRAFPKGLMTRPIELDRFLSFAIDFVSYHNFPQYLIELARLGYYYTKVADTPIGHVDRKVTPPADQNFQFYYHVHLKEPYKILSFKYDVLSIAKYQPDVNANYPYNPISLFMQKDWDKAKTTHINYTNDIFLLDLLYQGPQAVSDILANSPVQNYNDAIGGLLSLYKNGIIEFSIPEHFPLK